MKALSLILRVVAILGAVAAVALFMMVQGKVEDKENELVAAQAQLSTTQGEKENLAADKAALQSQVKELEAKVADQTSIISRINTNLSEAQRKTSTLESDLEKTKSTLETRESEIAQLKKDIVNAQLLGNNNEDEAGDEEADDGKVAELTTQLQAANDTIADLRADLETATTQLEDLRETFKSVRSAAEEATTGVREISRANFQTVQVLQARPESGLVVIDLGTNRGAKVNEKVDLTRNNELVANLNITRVFPDYSLAAILPGSPEPKLLESGQSFQTIR